MTGDKTPIRAPKRRKKTKNGRKKSEKARGPMHWQKKTARTTDGKSILRSASRPPSV
jgi:hypothetical protein